jgi:hypothetical protein
MQLNRVGWLLVVIFALMGSGAFVAGISGGEALTTLWGAAFLAAAGGMIVFAVRSRRQATRDEAFHQAAIRGICTIVEANRIGSSFGNPELRLTIDVIVGDRPPSRAQTTLHVPDYVAFKMRPGLVLPVHVSPDDPSQVLVQW